MTDDKEQKHDDDLINYWMNQVGQSKLIDHIADYRNRGQRYSRDSLDALNRAWHDILQNYINTLYDQSIILARSDIEAEFHIRNEPLPTASARREPSFNKSSHEGFRSRVCRSRSFSGRQPFHGRGHRETRVPNEGQAELKFAVGLASFSKPKI